MRVLVVGGTLFVGPAVVRSLLAAGHAVAVLHRGRTPGDLPPEVLHVMGERDRLPEARGDLERFRPDVVVHDVIVNEGHARLLLDAVRGIVPRVVMLSSQDVYRAYGRIQGTEPGPPDPVPGDEDSPLREVLFPYRSHAKDEQDLRWSYDKIPAERLLLGAPDVAATVLRLPMVIGPGDYQHRLFPFWRPMADGRRAILLHDEYARWRSTYGYVENVGAAVAAAATDERAAGRVYDVGDASPSVLELGRAVARAMGWEGEFLLRPRSALPDALVASFDVRQDLVCRCERIRGELGVRPVVAPEEAIRRTLAWERVHPPAPGTEGRRTYEEEDRVLAAEAGGASNHPSPRP